MKGSTKFWIIVLVPLLLFLNYKSIPIFINNLNDLNSAIPTTILIIWAVESFAILFFIILPLIFGENGLLYRFNKWLDEKF